MFWVMIELTKNGEPPLVIQYMPAGEHRICATVNGEPGERRVVVDEAAVGRLNADLAELLAAARAGEKARPVLFFDHKQGEAAAFPRRFVWGGEEKGILLELEGWSAAGRAAVMGKNYSYLSPAFRLSRQDGQVLGLVGGVEVASLVNDPAFQTIEPIAEGVAAAHAELGEGVDIIGAAGAARISTNGHLEKAAGDSHNIDAAEKAGNKTMNEELKKKLGLAPDADEAAVDAAVAELISQLEAHKKKAEETQAALDEKSAAFVEKEEECKKKDEELQAARAAEKEAWLGDLKQRGVIAPKDEEAVKAASALFDANAAAARMAYSKMTRSDDAPIIEASHVLPAGKSGERVEDFISFGE